jgi:uncharacterized protein (DUF305 family)
VDLKMKLSEKQKNLFRAFREVRDELLDEGPREYEEMKEMFMKWFNSLNLERQLGTVNELIAKYLPFEK